MNKFSVVLPIHGNRDGRRPICSVLNQQNAQGQPYLNWELLVVEDDNARVSDLLRDFVIVVSHHNERLERAISRNQGMQAAQYDWIIWLDSDDEFTSTLFFVLDYVIKNNPDYKIFNWGSVVHWEPKNRDEENYEPRTTIRPVAKIPGAARGLKRFKTGLIGAGSFCVHKSVLDALGGLPEHSSPYGFAEMAKKEFSEWADPKSDVYLVDTLGNPWGDDYYFVYKITRQYKMRPIDFLGYIQHVRR